MITEQKFKDLINDIKLKYPVIGGAIDSKLEDWGIRKWDRKIQEFVYHLDRPIAQQLVNEMIKLILQYDR